MSLSLKIRGIDPRQRLIRQTGGTLDMNEDGSWKATERFICAWESVMRLAPARNRTQHPDFSTLICTNCRISREPAGMALVWVFYSGPLQDATEAIPEPIEEVNGAGGEQPIETHVRYAAVTRTEHQKIKAALKASDAATVSTPSGLGSLAEELLDKMLKGQESYIAPGAIAKRTSFSTTKPNVLANIGEIDNPGFVSGGGDRNWLKMTHSWRRQGGLYQVEESWQLSGNAGWDANLYS